MAIEILSRDLSEKIAAGEVVDRPASVVKELVENSIDADASIIEVEIVSNGLASIRITDNGKGIPEGDIEKAFLRHATSKVSKEEDLYSIKTLGFRGEALAAISAVSRVKMISRTQEQQTAVCYMIEGGEEVSYESVGADFGTTIMVKELFYNTPARLKFLKKDVSEGNAVQTLMQQLALSHPLISFKFIRDNKTVFTTPKDANLLSAAYAVLPREIASNLMPLATGEGSYAVSVDGYIGRPEISRKSRAFQYVFVNNRYVKSATVIAAVEQAYRSMNLSGGFPVFIINITMPFELVDVNVHPAKTEVRFANEQEIFSSVHRSVMIALGSLSDNVKPNTGIWPDLSKRTPQPSERQEAARNSNTHNFMSDKFMLSGNIPLQQKSDSNIKYQPITPKPLNSLSHAVNLTAAPLSETSTPEPLSLQFISDIAGEASETSETIGDVAYQFIVIGELFNLYILVSYQDSLVLIDKHAAHERVLFEAIKDIDLSESKQILLLPETITVSPEEKRVLLENHTILDQLGFLCEEFGEHEIAVREVPMYFTGSGVTDAILEIAEKLLIGDEDPMTSKGLWLLKSVSCRAAVKGGYISRQAELVELTKNIMFGNIPKYCPHGRNVYVMMSKQEIDKQFGR
ncbi:MAG: DNA mismatch repair endonuclease MutL [Oscillospiraceae bacterium]|nr:DNA mismatch repair endonuclease MutL [Oscillospiraceae bacterium]